MRVIGERNGDRRERRESAMREGGRERAIAEGRVLGARVPGQCQGRHTNWMEGLQRGKKFLLPYMTTGVSNNHTACLLGHSYSQK